VTLTEIQKDVAEGRRLKIVQGPDAEVQQRYPTTPALLLRQGAKSQKALNSLKMDIKAAQLLEDLDTVQRAVALSERSRGASAWLQAIPSSPHLFMPSDSFRAAIRDRLLIPPRNGPVPMCSHRDCPLYDATDPDDAARELRRHCHGMGACTRHARVVKQVTLMLSAANIPSTPEPIVQKNPQLRGDIAEQHTHNRGFKTVYDVSITDTTKRETLQAAAAKAGAAAAAQKQRKINKYTTACRNIDARFFPLIFETSGYIDQSVFDLIEQISLFLPDNSVSIPEFTTWAAPTFKQYWLQRITIALRGGSAVMALRNWNARLRGDDA
jgi:hypothetical protein